MTPNSDLFNPVSHYLELSSTALAQAWQQSQFGSTAASRWNAYLNQVSLDAILPWLRNERDARATVWTNPGALPSFWEVVNGTAIVLNNKKLVLIPSEAIDTSELRVPQEWVDIPGWAADYYLAVQVDPDELSIKLWGYCTHQQLKTEGEYIPGDRTYTLDEDQLIPDLSLLWVTAQVFAEPTRAAVPSLPKLALTQAESLLQRLGNPAVLEPRLAVPFHLWGALLEHGGWRQRLLEKRQGIPEQRSIVQWLQSGISNLGQLTWTQIQFQPSGAGARSTETPLSTTALSRQLTIAGQAYTLRILPIGSPDARNWRFELRSASPGNLIPSGFKLRLLTEDLQPFEGSEDVANTAVAELYIDVTLAPEEGIVWEVEPTPETYDQEILRF
ncbi:MAG TPA: DUF1822 family protein [Trichocoleus sp.]|jgi:hypothetical protein